MILLLIGGIHDSDPMVIVFNIYLFSYASSAFLQHAAIIIFYGYMGSPRHFNKKDNNDFILILRLYFAKIKMHLIEYHDFSASPLTFSIEFNDDKRTYRF